VETVEYAPGRLADTFGSPMAPTVLMWHGAQADARVTMAPLAGLVADHGFAVVVPDWDSHAEDRGRGDLLRSLRFAREHSADPDAIVLVGWSLGGVAAAGTTIHSSRLGIRIGQTICLAGAFMVSDPISGDPLPSDLPASRSRTPFTLLHGDDDDVIPVKVSQEFAAELRRNKWPVEFKEIEADHGAIAGATYDAAADRYSPGRDARTLTVAAEVATLIVNAVETTPK
jgi:dipeptidyl aminopeptidase/acylaminoacyl peptidase